MLNVDALTINCQLLSECCTCTHAALFFRNDRSVQIRGHKNLWIGHITVFKNCYLCASVRDSPIDNNLWQMWVALKSCNLYLYCVSGEEGSMECFFSIMADQCPCVDTIQTLWSGDRGHYATCHHATTLEFFNFDIGRVVMNTQYSERGLNLN